MENRGQIELYMHFGMPESVAREVVNSPEEEDEDEEHNF